MACADLYQNIGAEVLDRASPSSLVPKTQRMPREGAAAGGGAMRVLDRSLFEGQVRDCDRSAHEEPPPAGLDRKSRRGSVSVGGNRSLNTFEMSRGNLSEPNSLAGTKRSTQTRKTAASAMTETPRSSEGGKDKTAKQRVGPKERKEREMCAKWEKLEAVRTRDHKRIAERIEQTKELRDERFKRLLSSLSGQGCLAYEIALGVRERDDRLANRQHQLYKEWDEKIHQPMVAQAFQHMNPPNRAIEQRISGTKTVGWTLPDYDFKMICKVDGDPIRRPMVEHARETAFHQTAEKVLGRSQSAPSMPNMGSLDTALNGSAVLRARSRPMLEPQGWSQTMLQGSCYGHFAQTTELGNELRRTVRGGSDAHLPDESDGVNAAGTRKSRITGYHSKGTLHGDCATRGEAAQYKQDHGQSNSAPMQDHYHFPNGHEVTDLEFPLGKRLLTH